MQVFRYTMVHYRSTERTSYQPHSKQGMPHLWLLVSMIIKSVRFPSIWENRIQQESRCFCPLGEAKAERMIMHWSTEPIVRSGWLCDNYDKGQTPPLLIFGSQEDDLIYSLYYSMDQNYTRQENLSFRVLSQILVWSQEFCWLLFGCICECEAFYLRSKELWAWDSTDCFIGDVCHSYLSGEDCDPDLNSTFKKDLDSAFEVTHKFFLTGFLWELQGFTLSVFLPSENHSKWKTIKDTDGKACSHLICILISSSFQGLKVTLLTCCGCFVLSVKTSWLPCVREKISLISSAVRLFF